MNNLSVLVSGSIFARLATRSISLWICVLLLLFINVHEGTVFFNGLLFLFLLLWSTQHLIISLAFLSTQSFSLLLEISKHILSLAHHSNHVCHHWIHVVGKGWRWHLKYDRVWLHIGTRGKVIRSWILHSVRSEHCDARWIEWHPLIPSAPPSIVVNKYLAFSDVNNLSFQPLVNCVLHVYPLTNFIPSSFSVKGM